MNFPAIIAINLHLFHGFSIAILNNHMVNHPSWLRRRSTACWFSSATEMGDRNGMSRDGN